MNTMKKQFSRFDLNDLKLVNWAAFTVYFWLLWAYVPRSNGIILISTEFVIASIAGIIANYILQSIGYYDPFRIVPRKSDYLLLLFSVGIAGVTSSLIHTKLLGYTDSGIVRITLSLPWVSVAFFFIYRYLTLKLTRVRRRRVALHLTMEETAEFTRMIKESHLSREIEIVPSQQAIREFSLSRTPGVDLIVFSRAASRDMKTDQFLLRAHLAGIPIVDRRSSLASMSKKINIDDIDIWSFISSAQPQTAWIRFGRTIQDWLEPVFALFTLIALSPILAFIAIAIKATSPGPVFYSQKRTGYLGRVFNLYKFRSMRTDSESQGYRWAQKEDPRVTPVGKFLRKTRLDELPQLWNVAMGDMLLVGPRPERPEIYQDLSEKIPLFYLRTNVRPGITGWAQVCAGYAASIEESKLKLEHDLYYIQNMSLRLDLVIILMTIKVVLFGNEFIQKPGAELPSRTLTAAEIKGLRKRVRLKNRRAV